MPCMIPEFFMNQVREEIGDEYREFVLCINQIRISNTIDGNLFRRTSNMISSNPRLVLQFFNLCKVVQPGTVSFVILSTEQLLNDLDGLDNLLAHMLPTLEMRDVVVNNFSFECISSPSIFLLDFQKLHDDFHAPGISRDVQIALYETFKTIQSNKQTYTGHRFALPNAGNYTIVETRTGFASSLLFTTEKPNAIKAIDLELSLPLLLEKVAIFTEQRLHISKMQYMWEMVMIQNITGEQKDLFNPELAGNIHSLPYNPYRDANSSEGTKFFTQKEFDNIQLTAVEIRAVLEKDFQKNELEHIRLAAMNLRERMRLIARCSLELQMALRIGVGEPRIEASVGAVRLLWEKELANRYKSKKVHPADMI